MIKNFAVWLYLRFISTITMVLAIVLSAFGITSAVETMTWMQRAGSFPATVVEMVDKPAAPNSSNTGSSNTGSSNTGSTNNGSTNATAPAPALKPSTSIGSAQCQPFQAPVFVWSDAKGAQHKFAHSTYHCPPRFKVGDRSSVLVDPQNDKNIVLDTGGNRSLNASFPLVFSGIGTVVVLVLSYLFWPDRKRVTSLLLDPAAADTTVPLAPDMAHAKPLGPLQGIVASADHIEDGQYPLELCEFTAYLAALAYHDPDKKHPVTLEEFLKSNFREIRHIRRFDRDDTQGFGFVFDNAAFIIMRGTKGWGDWKRNLNARYTGSHDFLPPGVDWSAPARHRGFADGWNVIRQDVEDWIAETGILKGDPKFPFVFSGHSLGGALAFLGAWEFAKRGRHVAAVITFGAARPGGKAFAAEYAELGLDKRTLRLEFTQDIVPLAQSMIGYQTVGHAWTPQQIPLLSSGLALSALPLNWLVGALQESLFGSSDDAKSKGKKPQSGTVNTSTSSPSKPGPPLPAPPTRPKTLRQIIAWWLLRLVLLVAFSSVIALAAHKMQKRYALALSIMSYRRIRARHEAAAALSAGGPGVPTIDYNAAYDDLCEHLQTIRGSKPSDPKLYDSLKNLPRKLEGPSDLKWLNAFHQGRAW